MTTVLKEQKINLNIAAPQEIEKFLNEKQLLTYADIGRELGLSRERIRQIFTNRKDLNFKKIKSKIVKKKYHNNAVQVKNWRLIQFVKTRYNYYVSDDGKISRDVVRKRHGVEFTERKLLRPSANKMGHLRVNLTLETGEHKTFYLHQIVANEWLPKPDKNRRLKGVGHHDGDLSNCKKSNLYWSYFN